MSRTIAEVRNLVRTHIGITANDRGVTDEVLDVLINSALRRVTVEADWPWLEDTYDYIAEAGQDVLEEPVVGVRRVRWVRHQDRELSFVNYRDVPDFYGASGEPWAFTEDAGVYYLLPTPDREYEITYGLIVDLDDELSGEDETYVPDYAIDMLVSQTCLLVSRRLRERDQEKVYYSEYMRAVARLKDEMAEHTQGTLPRRVGYSF